MPFEEFLCSDAFEYLDYVCWCKYRMSIDEEVDMVGHDFLINKFNAFLLCDYGM